MRYIIVGDVHGCFEPLRRLMKKVRLEQADCLVFVGDLINKGSNSRAAVRYLRQLRESGQEIVLVGGNHEEKFLRYVRHETKRQANSTPNPIEDAKGQLANLLAELDEEDISFLRTWVLYEKLPAAFGGSLVVHAGIERAQDRLPGLTEFNQMSNTKRQKYMTMMRVRRINAEGHMIKLSDATESDPFWAEEYDGRFGHVFFGHMSVLAGKPTEFPHATGLDLGAVYGGRLCAALVERGPRTSYLTVPGATSPATFDSGATLS